jgi:hypothetical protein
MMNITNKPLVCVVCWQADAVRDARDVRKGRAELPHGWLRALVRLAMLTMLQTFATVATLAPLALLVPPAQLHAQPVTFQHATYVVGQPNFTANTLAQGLQGLYIPDGVAVDVAHGKLYVTDRFNHRVLRFAYPLTANYPVAELIFGQSNASANTPDAGLGSTNQFGFHNPTDIAVNAQGDIVVADISNNRLVRFAAAHAIPNGMHRPAASGVVGQAAFTANVSATSASTLQGTHGACFDNAGNLYVTGVNRVLRFSAAELTKTPPMAPQADVVIGAADFLTAGAFTSPPSLLSVAWANNSLYIVRASGIQNFVYRYDGIGPATPANTAIVAAPAATLNITGMSGSGANQLNETRSVAVGGGLLYVADQNNHRIQVFDALFPSGASALYSIGQVRTDENISGCTQQRLNEPRAMAFADGKLFVTEELNHRVLQFDIPPPMVSSMTQRNAQAVPSAQPTTFSFTQAMGLGAASSAAIRTFSNQRGLSSPGTFSGGGTAAITFNPLVSYRAGEQIHFSVTRQARSAAGNIPIAMPFVGQFRARAASGTGEFYEVTRLGLPTPTVEAAVKLADCNNDGRLDIVAVNDTPTLTIFTNNGNGSYTPNTVNVGANATRLDVGDLNNDGRIDIVVAFSSANIGVVMNTTSGFVVQGPYSTTGGSNGSVSVGDVNGDGNLDVARANYPDQEVAVFLGNGSATPISGVGTNYDFGDDVSAATLADIDNDGDVDVTALRWTGARLSTALNQQSSGVFAASTAFGASTQGLSITSADLNGDGFVDMVTSSDNGDVTISLNSGTGTFPTVAQTLSVAGSQARAVVLADVNADGLLDVCAAFENPASRVNVYRGLGGGMFATTPLTLPLSSGSNPFYLDAGDVDNDGDIDLVVPNSGAGNENIIIFLNGTPPVISATAPARNSNTAPNTVAISTTWSQPMTSATATLPTAPVNARALHVWGSETGFRALPSRATATQTANQTTFTPTQPFRPGEHVWVSVTNARATPSLIPHQRSAVWSFRARSAAASGTFQLAPSMPRTLGGDAFGAMFGDMDGDGNLDIVTSDYSGVVSVFYNSGNASYSAPQTIVVSGGASLQDLCIADWNNDGRPDIGVAFGTSLYVTLNQGNRSFGAVTAASGATAASAVSAADVDSDGDLDALVANYDGIGTGTVNVFANDGTGTFSLLSSVPFGSGNCRRVSLGDVDGDGDVDMAVPLQFSGFDGVVVWLNDGKGQNWVQSLSLMLPAACESAELVDVNNDGRLDLVASTIFTSQVSVSLGNGNGTFGAATAYNLPASTGRLGMGDVNGDGAVDVVVAGGGNVFTLLNNGSGAFAVQSTRLSSGIPAINTTLGDADGDGDLDALVVVSANQIAVLLNETPPVVTARQPERHTMNVAANAALQFTFSQPMTTATASAQVLNAFGSMSGKKLNGSFAMPSASQAQGTFSPPFRPNELVSVSISGGRSAAKGIVNQPHVVQYRAQAPTGAGNLVREPLVTQLSAAAGGGGGSYAADFTGDGAVDIAAVLNPNRLVILRNANNGTGQFTEFSAGTVPVFAGLQGGDLDGDGDTDLILQTAPSFIIENLGGTFAAAAALPVLSNRAIPADVDGDGDVDLLCSNGTNLRVLTNTGSGSIIARFAPAVDYAAGVGITALHPGDFDNDGDLDALILDASGAGRLMLNNGAGAFSQGSALNTSRSSPLVHTADLNADGRLDVVVMSVGGGAPLFIGINTGSNTFTPLALNAAGAPGFSNVQLGDLDGNGSIDLLGVTAGAPPNQRAVQAFLNNGSGVLTFNNNPALAGGAVVVGEHLTAADVDNDGDVDVVAIGSTLPALNPTATLFRNQQAPTLNFSQPVIDFGAVDVGTTVDSLVTLTGSFVADSVVLRQYLMSLPMPPASPSPFTSATVSAVPVVNWTASPQTPRVTIARPPSVAANNVSVTLRVRFSPTTTATVTDSLTAALGSTALAASNPQPLVVLRGAGVVPSTAPTISRIEPAFAPALSQVRVVGRNFVQSTVPPTTLRVGTVVVPVTVVNSTTLTFIAPPNVTTAAITLSAANGSTTSSQRFTLVTPPRVVSVSTTLTVASSTLTLTGAFFTGSTNPNASAVLSVSLGTVQIPLSDVTVLSGSQMRIIAPSVAVQGSVRITTAFGSTSSSFQVRVVVSPVVGNFSPTGSSTGATLNVFGANLQSVQRVEFVDVNTLQSVTAAEFRVESPVQLVVTVPPNTLANGSALVAVRRLRVMGELGLSSTAAAQFEYLPPAQVPPPIVSGIEPALASTNSIITLTGANLDSAQVLIGGVPAEIVSNDGVRVVVRVPSGLVSSTNTITLITSSGTVRSPLPLRIPPAMMSNGGHGGSTAATLEAPILLALSTTQANAGDTVVVSGANFQRLSTVLVGGVAAQFVVLSPTRLLLFVPPSGGQPSPTSGASGLVVLQNSVGSSSTRPNAAFTLNPVSAPVVTSFTPSVVQPGSTVVVTGANFTWVDRVLIGGVPVARFRVDSPTQLTLTLPNAASRLAEPPLVLSSVGGNATFTLRFTESLERDSSWLNRLYIALGGPRWFNQTNWTTSSVAASWFGVSVENNRIVALRLPSNNLSLAEGRWAVPLALIKELTALRVLDLSGAPLGGTIEEIADSLQNLPLQELNLSNTALTSASAQPTASTLSSLSSLCRWRNLRVLKVSQNRLGGTLATSMGACLGELSALEELDLSQNQFTGDIPPQLANVRRLRVLNLSGNRLTGSLPRNFATAVVQQQLTGSAKTPSAAGVAALPELRVLDVSGNQLSGTVPSEYGVLTGLEQVLLGNNRFEGAVPASWGALRLLRRLELHNNRLTALPAVAATLRRLDTLRVEQNALDFGSLEPNAAIERFTYIPQDSVGNRVDTAFVLNAAATLSAERTKIPTGGASTRFQWFRRSVGANAAMSAIWELLHTQTRPTLTFAAFSAAEAGEYECRLTNPRVPNLILYSRTVTLRAQTAQGMQGGGSGGSGGTDTTLVGIVSRLALTGREFGTVTIGDTATGLVSLRNLGTEAVTLLRVQVERSGMMSAEGTFQFFEQVPNQVQNVRLAANQEITLPVRFLPRETSLHRASVLVEYQRDAGSGASGVSGSSATERFVNALSGRATALKLFAVEFDTVRVRRRAVATALVVNRGRVPVVVQRRLVLTQMPAPQAFSVDNEATVLGVGDTTAITVRCLVSETGVQRGVLRLESRDEAVETSIRAVGRLPRVTDVSLVPELRVVPDSAAAGELVELQVRLSAAMSDTARRALFNAAQPELRAQIAFDRNVLVLDASESRSTVTRSETPQNRQTVLNIPTTRWNGSSAVLARVPLRVVSGDTNRTTLRLLGLQWGNGTNANTATATGENAIMVEEPVEGVFRSLLCTTTELRRTRISNAVSLSKSRPNPASDEAELTYSVREAGEIVLGLYALTGSKIATLVQGWHEPGEYVVRVQMRGVPSGAYRIVLQTPSEQRSERLELVR